MKIKFLPLLLAVACNGIPQEVQQMETEPRRWTVTQAPCPGTKAGPESVRGGYQVAIYDSVTGDLVYTDQSNSGGEFYPASETLHCGRRYNWYMLSGGIAADRGSGSSISFPASDSAVKDILYECPGSLASSLASWGLDLSGMLISLTPEDADALDGSSDGYIHIPLERLWCKVTLSVNTSAMANYTVTINSVVAGKGCKVFKPFDPQGYAAASASQMAASPGCGSLSAAQKSGAEPIILYFPENRQGTLLPGNADPYTKSTDAVQAAFPGKENLVNTIELDCSVSSSFGVSAVGKYRLCLGGNNTCDFSLVRNTAYDIVLDPTEEGLQMDIWKSSFDITDARTLTLTGIKGKGTDMDGPYAITGTPVPLEAGGRCYAFARYSDGTQDGPDFTVSSLDAGTGWRVSAESAVALEDAGISWTIARRKGFADNTQGLLFWTEEEYAVQRPLHIGSDIHNLSWEAVFEFTSPAGTADGQSIPVTVETFDGLKKATVTLQTGSGGKLQFSGLENARYIGQKGNLRVTAFPAGYSKAKFSCTSGLVSIRTLSDTACEVSLLGSGTATINISLWNGSAWISTDPLTGKAYKATVSISVPRLIVSPTAVQLQADGTPVSFTAEYRNWSGEPVDFDSTLYETYLKPVVSLQGVLRNYLTCTDGATPGTKSLSVRRLTYSSHNVTEYAGTSYPTAVSVSARNCADIASASVGVTIAVPFPGATSSRLLKVITHHSLDRGRYSYTVSDGSIATGESFSIEGGSNLDPASVEIIAPASDLGFSLESPGRIKTTLLGSGTPASGVIPLQARFTNSVSGQTLTQDLGYVEVYLVSCLGARAVAPMDDTMMYDTEVYETVFRRQSIAVLADVVYRNAAGTQSDGMKALHDVLSNQYFLRMSSLPQRMTNYNVEYVSYLADYLRKPPYAATYIPFYMNRDLLHHANGTPCSGIMDGLNWGETFFDCTLIRGLKTFGPPVDFPDPRSPQYAVWTYLPGTNILSRWDGLRASNPTAFPDYGACFLYENVPAIKVEKDVIAAVLAYSNYGSCTFFYDDSATKGSEGLPFCLLAVNRTDSDALPLFWESCSVSGF